VCVGQGYVVLLSVVCIVALFPLPFPLFVVCEVTVGRFIRIGVLYCICYVRSFIIIKVHSEVIKTPLFPCLHCLITFHQTIKLILVCRVRRGVVSTKINLIGVPTHLLCTCVSTSLLSAPVGNVTAVL
jgi:hypothetical protein